MKDVENILIATDGSEYTKDAVEQELQLAKLLGVKATALFVVDQTPFSSLPPDSTVVSSVNTIMENEGKHAVEEVKKRDDKMRVVVDPIVLDGSPINIILDSVADHDLIVLGTLGRSALSKLFMGSVAERVTRYAPCPVLLVRARKG